MSPAGLRRFLLLSAVSWAPRGRAVGRAGGRAVAGPRGAAQLRSIQIHDRFMIGKGNGPQLRRNSVTA